MKNRFQYRPGSVVGWVLLMLLCNPLVGQAVQEEMKKETQEKAAQKKKVLSPAELMEEFQAKWDDGKWEKKFRGQEYMRATDEEGWMTRMETMQGLVAAGESALPVLMDGLSDEDVPTQVFSAQTLGYLAPHADIDALTKAFKAAKDPAVRLYLVDALGMSGQGKNVDWDDLGSNERNRDVRKHIGYAKERKDSPVKDSIVKSLVDWDLKTMNSAEVGKPAPDFEMETFDGKQYSLSQFKGKQPVVLVFVYGDT